MTQYKKTVLHFIDSLDYGGAETMLKSYIPLLPQYRHIVVVLGQQIQISTKGFTFINLNLSPKKGFFKASLQLRKIIKAHKVVIVHSHSYWTNIISRIATPRNVQLLNHYHFADYDTYSKKISVKRMIFLDKLLRHRKVIRIAVSEYVECVLRKIFPNSEILTIPNFVVSSLTNTLIEDKSYSTLKIIVVGNCKFEKNYDLILDAFILLRGLPVSVDIIGGGGLLLQFSTKAKNLALENVNFLGFKADPFSLMPDYDLFLSTSLSETFGIVLLEAMAAKLPLLVSDIPAFKEIAKNCATFFDPNSSQDLANKIIDFLKDPKSPDLVQYKKILNKYSHSNFLEELLQVYEQKQV